MQRLPSGARLEFYDTIDSTSAEAKRRAAAGDTGPLWILAREQTAGYGRRGRAWETGAENFAATYLFAPEGRPADLGQLSYVVALAVIEALDPYAIIGALGLKWPNDILAGAAKLAGILLESIQAESRRVLCIGIGVNLNSSPSSATPYPTAKLADHLRDGAQLPTPQNLVSEVDAHITALYAIWRREGFAPIRAAWLQRARGVGETIRVMLPENEIVGVFRDIDETGALIIFSGGKDRRITAGEMMFGE